jgi:hypothetical protein
MHSMEPLKNMYISVPLLHKLISIQNSFGVVYQPVLHLADAGVPSSVRKEYLQPTSLSKCKQEKKNHLL